MHWDEFVGGKWSIHEIWALLATSNFDYATSYLALNIKNLTLATLLHIPSGLVQYGQ